MREKEEVLEKFQELRRAKLNERKQRFLCKSFMNCRHNARFRVKGKGQVGFCQNEVVLSKTTRRMFVCNEDETAQRCRVFDCRNTDDSVEKDFDEIMKSPAQCGNEYPKLAVLIWFLQEPDSPGRQERFLYLSAKAFGSLWKIMTFRWW